MTCCSTYSTMSSKKQQGCGISAPFVYCHRTQATVAERAVKPVGSGRETCPRADGRCAGEQLSGVCRVRAGLQLCPFLGCVLTQQSGGRPCCWEGGEGELPTPLTPSLATTNFRLWLDPAQRESKPLFQQPCQPNRKTNVVTEEEMSSLVIP